MKRISVAIEVADENLCAQEIRTRAELEYGTRIVLNPNYADRMILVLPDTPTENTTLKEALERFGVTTATPSSLCDALCDPALDATAAPRKRLRLMFREFKSNPLHDVDLRGKDPADPDKRARKLRAKRFKEAFYEALAEFISTHPGLSYKDYWDADGRPYEKQWPEYRRAVKRAKEMSVG
jgi:hypothetical protein|nr:MAG TPA: hypothetical protein [Caudoviricetes sp.]